MPPPRAVLAELRRAVSWHRRLLAAGLAAGAVAMGLEAVAPAPPPTATVTVAARDLAAGTPVTADDLADAHLPPGAVPRGVLGAGELVGRTLAAPVRAGEPVTDVRLVGPALVSAAGPGLVAAPVRVADPGAVRLLRPGDRVDVLAAAVLDAPGDGVAPATPVVSGARVLAVPDPGDEGVLAEGALVLLAMPPSRAAAVAGAAAATRLSVVLLGP